MLKDKKVSFSGIQPSGTLTLGNYLGAVKNWKKFEDDYLSLYCVVDMHAITVRQDPKKFKEQCLKMLACVIACGLDPEKNIIYFQSHVPQHAELAWILNCYTMFGELSRMTQFKDKSRKHSDNVNAGLFTYPALMAADILLYQTDIVPVGTDQKQHLELARDIAVRFNNFYPNTFTIPEGYIPKTGAKIMSLADPLKKMSKSDENINATVFVDDDKDTIMRKFKRAVTDSGSEVVFAENKDGINNLINIYSIFTKKSVKEIEAEFANKGYGEFKTAVGEAVCEGFFPIREKYQLLLDSKDELEKIYKHGAEQASYYANITLNKVKKKLGFVL